nr:hypothetical protein [Pseudonocardia sp.]
MTKPLQIVASSCRSTHASPLDLGVEIRANPRHLALGDPGVRAQGFDQVVDLAGGHAVQVGLHHHREQRLIHPAAALEQ